MPEVVSHTLVQALRSVPDFAALDDRALLRIVGASANLVWSPGSSVFDAGSTSEALYIVLSGEVSVCERMQAGGSEIARLRPGDSFGELSLMLHTAHTKDAHATELTELMVLPRESFEELLATNPDLAARFRHRLEERLPVRGAITDTT